MLLVESAISVRPYSAVLRREPQYLWYVSLCLLVWRNAAIFLDRTGTRVIGSERQALVALELLEQPAEELGRAVETLGGIERVGYAEATRRRVHELAQAFGADAGLCARVEVRLRFDEARQERWGHAVLAGGTRDH